MTPNEELSTTKADRTTKERLEIGTAAIVLLTAIISAVVGFRSASVSKDKASTAQQQSSQVSSQNQGLQKQLSDAQSTIAALQASLAAAQDPAPSPSPTDPGVALPDNVSVRRTTGKNTIRLQPNYGVDLDNDSSPNWNAGNGPLGSSAGYGLDIQLDPTYEKVDILNDSAKESAGSSYSTCAQETDYANSGWALPKLRKGDEYCVRTTEQRFALVKIISASSAQLAFTVTVWDPPYGQ